MEQHPVPQNVTTFQFRLIGDMTIKQFGYLAVSAIVAYALYKTPFPLLLNYPLSIGTALLGFGLAFVPIEERPMDVWILSFFRNVYNPTVYIWQKSEPTPEPTPQVTNQSSAPQRVTVQSPMATQSPVVSTSQSVSTSTIINQQTVGSQPHSATEPKISPQVLVPSVSYQPGVPVQTRIIQTDAYTPMARPMPKQQQVTSPTEPAPLPQQKPKTVHAAFSFHPIAWIMELFHPSIRMDIQKPQPEHIAPVQTKFPTVTDITRFRKAQEPNPPPVQPTNTPTPAQPTIQAPMQSVAADVHIADLQKKLQEALLHKQVLEEKLSHIQTETSHPTPVPTPPVHHGVPAPYARSGVPRLTTYPNVVTGIVKDAAGNMVTGVLVTVRDKDDMPVRALKTNKLGQFAASTQLPNGTYDIEVEDPRNAYAFDKARITLTGEVVPTIEIVAKSQKELTRMKLAQEIFGNQKI